MRNRIGVCSWSLRPRSPSDLGRSVRACGLDAVQLALDPLRLGEWSVGETCEALEEAGVAILSGMMAMTGEDYTSLESIRRTGGVRANEHWESNRRAAREDARLARRLGLELVTFHAGFLPDDPRSRERAVLVERLREVVDCFADEGLRVGFETGQETAATLIGFLEELDRPSAGVNFDPANLLLYGMGDPVEALRLLAPHVRQMHVKDARRAKESGTWGEETPVGEGEVDWREFFRLIRDHPLESDLLIEREGGDERVRDVRRAHQLVRSHLPPRM